MLLIYRYIFVLSGGCRKHPAHRSEFPPGEQGFPDLPANPSEEWSRSLFVRAMKKSGALYDAMESRCYDGTIRVLNENYPPAGKEITAIVLFELALYAFLLAEKFCF